MALFGYLTQYRFRDMGELIRNGRGIPRETEGSLEGKTVVISGTTSGIGRETARLFASRGASLICLNRNAGKSEQLERELREKYSAPVRTIRVDFSSLPDTARCARELMDMKIPLDVIIHNAGVFYTRKRFTGEGIEMVFQVNHLSSFYLNCLLMDKLRRENRARIIYVNSEGHRFALAGVHLEDLEWKRHPYSGLGSYGAAKTAQLLTMGKFRELFAETAVTVNAMHPGNVRTGIGENNGPLYRRFKEKMILRTAGDPALSAKALLYLALSGDMAGVSGGYFNLTTPERPAPHGRDDSRVEAVWKKSRELCGLD